MSSVLGQVGQNVADNLFEIGQSAVKGTAGVVADVAKGTVEQIISTPNFSTVQTTDKQVGDKTNKDIEERKIMEKQRFEEVRSELARYLQWKKEQDRKIVEEKNEESVQTEQKSFVEKKKHDSWVNKIINRSQTATERGRLSE